jgi:type IV pilus assembly protein PilV
MQKQAGFSLIEILVAAVVMALGLSGLASLLLKSITGTVDAEYRTTAAILAGSLAAQIRLAQGAVNTFTAPAPDSAPICNGANFCTPAGFAENALYSWFAQIESSLPEGDARICRDSTPGDGSPGSYSCDGSGLLVIKIFWLDRQSSETSFQRYSMAVT